MKFFVDTANVEDIKKANDMGVICGVTTNPSLIAKEGRDFTEVIKEITSIVDGPISGEVKATTVDAEGMKRLWVDIRKTGEGICVKVRDNGGGYRVNSANYGTGTGIKVILQTIQLLNANNKKHIDISITNVQLEDGETGCEFAVFLPHGYDYNLKKMV